MQAITTTLIVLLLTGAWVESSQTEIQPAYALLAGGKSSTPLEGVIIEISSDGDFVLDSGTELKTLADLEKFVRDNKAVFSPRLIIEARRDSAAYYHQVMAALLVFEKCAAHYSCFIERGE